MARGLSITELSARTRIGVGYLQKIEEGDFRALPPGFYARAFVRAYAEGVGLDPDSVLGVLAETLPVPEGTVAHATPQAGSPGTSPPDVVPDARRHVLKQLLERHDTRGEAARPPAEPRATTPLPRRLLAASADGALLAAIYLGVFAVTAVYCGVSLDELARTSGPAVFTVLGVITLLYVLLMGGVAGTTIGAMLLDVPLISKPERPLDLPAIARRSMDCVRADVAAAVEVKTLVEGLFGRRRAA